MRDAEAVPTKVDRWRRDNPDALRTWETKRGCVVQFWGMRIYYGTCKECGGLVHTRRDVSRYRRGMTQRGRWPEHCDECARAKGRKHDDQARSRMARLREDRYKFREEQYRRVGLPAVQQGVSSGLTEPKDPEDEYFPPWLPDS